MQFHKYILNTKDHNLPWWRYANHTFLALSQIYFALIRDCLYLQKILEEIKFFRMTSFMALLFCFVNIQGRTLALIWSPLLFGSTIFFIAWLKSQISLQILTSFSLSCLPSNIFHSVSITFFQLCIVSNKCIISRFS